MIEKLHDAGLRSEHAYVAGFASIGLSFLAWATSLRAEKAGTDRADRWGIFVGHWAPTFFGLGNALRSYEKEPRRMGDYRKSQDVDTPAGQLFAYLSGISHLPRYFPAMTSAEPAGKDAVRVVANLNGTTREGEAWFRVDRERRHLEWGSEGPNDYHGSLDVDGDGSTSSVVVFLHTERHDSGGIEQGIADTLAAVKRLVEAGAAPGPER